MGKGRLGRKEAKAAPIPQKWDKEADVEAVGYGLAGTAAAMTAHDAGAKVFILEKMPKGKEGGNSLRVSRDAHKIITFTYYAFPVRLATCPARRG